MPLSVMATLDRLIEEASQGTGYAVASRLFTSLSGLLSVVDKIDNFIPLKYQIFTTLLKSLYIKEGADQSAEYFKQKQIDAAKGGKLMEAVANAMKMELASPEAKYAFFRSQ